MRIIRLLIAFDGTDFHGWQIQPDAPTVQGELQRHLSTMNSRPTTLHGAGRTDSGVHALGMVAHFHSHKTISCKVYKRGLNSLLPPSIRILETTEESLTFHSRFSAKGKTYCYTIFNGETLMPQERFYSLHILGKLDFSKMSKCLDMLVGTHDYGCFETAGSRDLSLNDSKGSTRTISEAKILNTKDFFYEILITGDGFLRHMVRNIVGTILEVGLNRRSVENFKDTLLSQKRSKAGATAPAHGLTLRKIYY